MIIGRQAGWADGSPQTGLEISLQEIARSPDELTLTIRQAPEEPFRDAGASSHGRDLPSGRGGVWIKRLQAQIAEQLRAAGAVTKRRA